MIVSPDLLERILAIAGFWVVDGEAHYGRSVCRTWMGCMSSPTAIATALVNSLGGRKRALRKCVRSPSPRQGLPAASAIVRCLIEADQPIGVLIQPNTKLMDLIHFIFIHFEHTDRHIFSLFLRCKTK